MAGGITYADLRFARSPPEKSQEEEPSEGELTYENLQVPRALEKEGAECGPVKNTPELPCWATACHRWRPMTNRPTLGALALCLFLLATNIALGVQYLQASRQLQQASRDHAAQSHVLGERTRLLQTGLEKSQRLLNQTEQDLNSTRKELHSTTEALWQSRAAENQTRRQLQHQKLRLDQVNHSLQREMESLKTNLSQATSCQQIGCCPHGWTLFRWKCLWASSERMTWTKSKSYCEGRSSRLLVLKPWSAREVWEAVGQALTQSFQESKSFWVGLQKEKETNWNSKWKWVDGSPYEGTEIPSSYRGYNAVMYDGQLSGGSSSWEYRFICERAASPAKPLPTERPWGNF